MVLLPSKGVSGEVILYLTQLDRAEMLQTRSDPLTEYRAINGVDLKKRETDLLIIKCLAWQYLLLLMNEKNKLSQLSCSFLSMKRNLLSLKFFDTLNYPV